MPVETFVLLAAAFGAGSGLLALITAAIGTWRAAAGLKQNASAIQSLEIKVDGRLSELLEKTTRVSHLLGREEMRVETDATAAALAETTKADTLKATQEHKP